MNQSNVINHSVLGKITITQVGSTQKNNTLYDMVFTPPKEFTEYSIGESWEQPVLCDVFGGEVQLMRFSGAIALVDGGFKYITKNIIDEFLGNFDRDLKILRDAIESLHRKHTKAMDKHIQGIRQKKLDLDSFSQYETNTPTIRYEDLISMMSGQYLTEEITVCEQDIANNSEFEMIICERKTEEVEDMYAREIWDMITDKTDSVAHFLKKQGIVIN